MRLSLLLLLGALGCSRTSKSVETDAAPAPLTAPSASTSSADAGARDAGPTFAEGEHAYEGTLGAKTNIAMELVRTGDDVRGSYRYASIGKSLALAGKIEPGGAIVLTETVNGQTTGTLRLHREGNDLVGEWRDPTGKKTFPVRLSPLRAVAREAGVPFAEQARRCLEDIMCPASEVSALFVASEDAREQGSDCYRFLDGAGVTRDLARGRACLERTVTGDCEGDSAFLGRAELATLRIDGVGGRVDIAGARQLFSKCFDDVTKDAVLAQATAKENDPKSPNADACKQGGTTLVWEECNARLRENERTRGLLAGKGVAATLSSDGITLLWRRTRPTTSTFARAYSTSTRSTAAARSVPPSP